jgi:hypothetical protein
VRIVLKCSTGGIRTEVARSERQWKSFLSWMLGVAGTRHVLASEGYRWVAPVSAFYTDAVQVVDLSAWNPLFPRSILTTTRRPGSQSRLCPDYLALRPRPSTQPSRIVNRLDFRTQTASREAQTLHAHALTLEPLHHVFVMEFSNNHNSTLGTFQDFQNLFYHCLTAFLNRF